MAEKNNNHTPPIYDLIEKLFPITRSITGDGVRQSLKIIKDDVIPDLSTKEVPSGEEVFDWKVPEEWNITDAYIKNAEGNKVVDFRESNLHLVSYSTPVNETMSLHKLKKHIHTLPEFPDRIPYITSYYKRDWGFCMSHNAFEKMEEGTYEVYIDSSLKDGSLTYGEFYHKGKSNQEFLLSCYICHPSMANDSLSGVALLAYLANELQQTETYYSYRFLFLPETIGSVTWLARNESTLDKIKYGLVATCLGDSGTFTYKKSRRGDAEIDQIAEYVIDRNASEYNVEDFFPFGSDERQFCSPGFNLPIGSLMRTRYHNFDEYHTSADNLDFIDAESLEKSFNMYLNIIKSAELNSTYLNLNPKCEPNLGKRGLLEKARTYDNFREIQRAYFWVLNFSDGNFSLLDIAQKSDLDLETLHNACQNLQGADLLRKL